MIAMKTYTVKEVAEILNTNPETVRRWIRGGKLHAEKASNKSGNLILETSLDTFVSSVPKYQKMLSSHISTTTAIVGAAALLAGSIVNNINTEKKNAKEATVSNDALLTIINSEIEKKQLNIKTKEESINKLQKEIEIEKKEIKSLLDFALSMQRGG